MHATAIRHITACQRMLIVALTLVPVVMVTAVSLPALLILPLAPNGMDRTSALITLLKGWTEAVLINSAGTARR